MGLNLFNTIWYTILLDSMQAYINNIYYVHIMKYKQQGMCIVRYVPHHKTKVVVVILISPPHLPTLLLL